MLPLQHLPVREPPLPGESLTSFVRRHVLAMGYESFARLLGLVIDARGSTPHHLEELDRGPSLKRLATLLGRDDPGLLTQTVHSLANSLVLLQKDARPAERCDSKTVLRFFELAKRPVCPSCLDDNGCYERLNWLVRPVTICGQHRCWLVDRCPHCRRMFRADRLDLHGCRCGHTLRDIPLTEVSPGIVARQAALVTWLSGADLPLAETSTAACFWWLERLMAAVVRTPSWIEQQQKVLGISAQIESQQVAWMAAVDILQHWPQRMNEFLDVFQTVDKKSAMATGTGRAFGRLLREASSLEKLGYSTPADALRKYLLGRFTRGHLNAKVCLFRAPEHRAGVEDREWLTQTQAAKQLRLRKSAIPDLVTRGLLDGQLLTAGQRTIGLVSSQSLSRLQSQLRNSLTIPSVADRLGIGRHAILDLIHAEALKQCVRTKSGWLVPREQIDILENAFRELPTCSKLESPWVTSRAATRRFGPTGLTLDLLIKFVMDGQVRAVRDLTQYNLRGLWVHERDVERCLPQIVEDRDRADGYSLHRLAAVLFPQQPLKEIVLRKWIRAGLLRAHRSAKRWFIDATEVDRFRATYCLARDACQALGITRSTLHRWEQCGQIAPVYSRRRNWGAGASIFLRADVERLRRPTTAA